MTRPIVLITGGGSGIGAATAKLASERGYDVAVNYKSNANAAAIIVKEIEGRGGRAIAGTLPVDVTFPEIGPSLFMAAELTAESAAPSIDLAIRRVK